MDLFVINRYDENASEDKQNDEDEKLKKLLDKVERNKLKRALQREKKREEKFHGKREDKDEKRSKKQDPIKEEFETNGTETALPELPKEETENTPKNQLTGFEILSAKHSKKQKNVKRVLPKWLREPTVIKTNLSRIKVSGLDKSLKKKLKENGVKYFFPVQAEVIPYVLRCNDHADVLFPRDICVSAPTGSGKTLAFVLPIVQALKRYTVKKIRALVILPTQDLATQIYQCFKTYTSDTNLSTLLVTGKTSFAVEQKQLVYQNSAFGFVSKVDILVCTAGRLVDHIKGTEGFCLKNLEYLVIDEADRVLDSVQHDWLYHLEKHIYDNARQGHSRILNLSTLQQNRPPQKLLFSATLSQDPEKLEKLSLFQPKLFTSIVESNDAENSKAEVADSFIGKYSTPNELTEKYIVCSLEMKPLVLYELIKSESLTKTIVFAHSVDTVHRLTILLRSLFKDKMNIEEISSHIDMKKRNQLMENFANGLIDVIICTDGLARGIDLPSVQCVILYSAPKHVKTYIHRAGRTARGFNSGLAVTMLHAEQVSKFQELLKKAGRSNLQEIELSEEDLEEDSYKKALEDLKNQLAKENKK